MEDCSTELITIEQDQLADAFPMVVEGLRAVIDRGDSTGWTEYDVYHELMNGTAELVVGYYDSVYSGFILLHPATDHLFIWALYTVPGYLHLFDSHWQPIVDAAKAAGLDKIKFGTTRPGWKKAAVKYGFELEELVFSRTI